MSIHLKGVAFSARLVMVVLPVGLLGVAIHLKGVAFSAGLMMVVLLVGLLGMGIYDLRLVLGFSRC